MTEPRWTPGPWSLSDENSDDLQQYARFGPIVVYAEDDCETHPVADCSCNHTCRDAEEQLANARLIRAAPELYKALRALTELYVLSVRLDDCRYLDPENEDEVIAARAALASVV